MKPSNLIAAGALALLAVVVLLGQTQGQTPGPAQAPRYTRVAVCDVGAVFNGYARGEDLNAQLDRNRALAQQEDQKRADAIKRIEDTLKQLKQGSKEYNARVEQRDRLAFERKAWREFEQMKFLDEHRRMMEAMYTEILDAVAATAKEKGYDLVVYREAVEIDSKTTTELYQKIAQRKCLYYNPAIDLTQAVLDRLNRQYKARG
ncbi:MAG: hypothetical protein AMJ81_09510 [Phycisphaerae bacterium SM23_33]|nr:MAG: hypothetical protein AMJ81_09510 [Phycisphaerae bacterium SM23_33]